jgi:hypothetical protein
MRAAYSRKVKEENKAIAREFKSVYAKDLKALSSNTDEELYNKLAWNANFNPELYGKTDFKTIVKEHKDKHINERMFLNHKSRNVLEVKYR